MAVDKLVDSTQLNSDLTAVANAIRTKSGTSAQLSFPNGMTQAIADLPADGTNYVDVTLTQDYTSGTSFVNALGTASGFANFFAVLTSDAPESGACIGTAVVISFQGSALRYLYRRNASGNWGWYAPGSQSAYANDVFRVWEVG